MSSNGDPIPPGAGIALPVPPRAPAGSTPVRPRCTLCDAPLPASSAGCLSCLLRAAREPHPGEVAAPALPGPCLGQPFGHYEIVAQDDGTPWELGRGAMGVTYRATDTVLRRAVALKVIDAHHAGHPVVRERFLREARAAAKLRHPNVASVFHYGEQEGECFYAMEFIEGETLASRVRRDGPLPVELALDLVAAEAHGIVHRDLKPANLMVVVGAGQDGDGDGGGGDDHTTSHRGRASLIVGTLTLLIALAAVAALVLGRGIPPPARRRRTWTTPVGGCRRDLRDRRRPGEERSRPAL